MGSEMGATLSHSSSSEEFLCSRALFFSRFSCSYNERYSSFVAQRLNRKTKPAFSLLCCQMVCDDSVPTLAHVSTVSVFIEELFVRHICRRLLEVERTEGANVHPRNSCSSFIRCSRMLLFFIYSGS